MKNRKVAFVGGGNMTRAIAGGLVDSGFASADIFISEPVDEARQSLADELPGVNLSANNNDNISPNCFFFRFILLCLSREKIVNS